MASLNKVILIGTLGRNVEFKTTQFGQKVATFSIVTSEKFKNKDGEKKEQIEWHNIVAWGKLGELANQYLIKGKSVYIEGKISTRSWADKEGNKHFKTEILATSMQFLSPFEANNSFTNDSQTLVEPAF
jgi:single-strand DNA-binding protein